MVVPARADLILLFLVGQAQHLILEVAIIFSPINSIIFDNLWTFIIAIPQPNKHSVLPISGVSYAIGGLFFLSEEYLFAPVLNIIDIFNARP